MCWSSGMSIPLLPTCFPLLVSRTAHWSSPNDISESSWSLLAPYSFRSSINSKWLMGFMSSASLYQAFIVLNTRVNGSMITMNNSSDKETPWTIHLLMLTCPRSVPPDVNTFFQFTMLLLILGFPNNLQAFQDPRMRHYIICLFVVCLEHTLKSFVHLPRQFFSILLSTSNYSFFPRDPFLQRNPSVYLLAVRSSPGVGITSLP